MKTPDSVAYMVIDDLSTVRKFNSVKFGVPSSPLVVGKRHIVFGCQERVCSTDYSLRVRLTSGKIDFVETAIQLSIEKATYLATAAANKLILLKLQR